MKKYDEIVKTDYSVPDDKSTLTKSSFSLGNLSPISNFLLDLEKIEKELIEEIGNTPSNDRETANKYATKLAHIRDYRNILIIGTNNVIINGIIKINTLSESKQNIGSDEDFYIIETNKPTYVELASKRIYEDLIEYWDVKRYYISIVPSSISTIKMPLNLLDYITGGSQHFDIVATHDVHPSLIDHERIPLIDFLKSLIVA